MLTLMCQLFVKRGKKAVMYKIFLEYNFFFLSKHVIRTKSIFHKAEGKVCS